jgi:hypothetical protein
MVEAVVLGVAQVQARVLLALELLTKVLLVEMMLVAQAEQVVAVVQERQVETGQVLMVVRVVKGYFLILLVLLRKEVAVAVAATMTALQGAQGAQVVVGQQQLMAHLDQEPLVLH